LHQVFDPIGIQNARKFLINLQHRKYIGDMKQKFDKVKHHGNTRGEEAL
jgi:hypothetical protein